jgi:hypothetical protein
VNETLMKSIDFNTRNFEKHISAILKSDYSLVCADISETHAGEFFVHAMYGTHGLLSSVYIQLLIVYQSDCKQHIAMVALDGHTANDLADAYNRAKKTTVDGLLCVEFEEQDLDKFYYCNQLCSHDWQKAYTEILQNTRKAGIDIDIEREIEDLQKIFDLNT